MQQHSAIGGLGTVGHLGCVCGTTVQWCNSDAQVSRQHKPNYMYCSHDASNHTPIQGGSRQIQHKQIPLAGIVSSGSKLMDVRMSKC